MERGDSYASVVSQLGLGGFGGGVVAAVIHHFAQISVPQTLFAASGVFAGALLGRIGALLVQGLVPVMTESWLAECRVTWTVVYGRKIADDRVREIQRRIDAGQGLP